MNCDNVHGAVEKGRDHISVSGIFKDVRFHSILNFGLFGPPYFLDVFTPPEILANFGPNPTFSAVRSTFF